MCEMNLKSRHEQFYITSHWKMSAKNTFILYCILMQLVVLLGQFVKLAKHFWSTSY